MNQAQKDKWIRDLLSGEYKQTVGALCMRMKSGECRYCGLGVLVEGAGVPRRPLPDTGGTVMVYDFGHGDINTMMPPYAFMGVPNHVLHKVSTLNDQDGWNFRELAEYIRENVPVEETA